MLYWIFWAVIGVSINLICLRTALVSARREHAAGPRGYPDGAHSN